jgi:hypothetical protein
MQLSMNPVGMIVHPTSWPTPTPPPGGSLRINGGRQGQHDSDAAIARGNRPQYGKTWTPAAVPKDYVPVVINGDMTFIKDFLNTDSMVHVEFLKFCLTLGKEDDALLVAILMRLELVAKGVPLNKVTNPFYEDPELYVEEKDIPEAPKNILGIMKAYTRCVMVYIFDFWFDFWFCIY